MQRQNPTNASSQISSRTTSRNIQISFRQQLQKLVSCTLTLGIAFVDGKTNVQLISIPALPWNAMNQFQVRGRGKASKYYLKLISTWFWKQRLNPRSYE